MYVGQTVSTRLRKLGAPTIKEDQKIRKYFIFLGLYDSFMLKRLAARNPQPEGREVKSITIATAENVKKKKRKNRCLFSFNSENSGKSPKKNRERDQCNQKKDSKRIGPKS